MLSQGPLLRTGRRRPCEEGCSKERLGSTGVCSAHGGGRRCQHEGCSKAAQGDTQYYVANGGGSVASTRAAVRQLLHAARRTAWRAARQAVPTRGLPHCCSRRHAILRRAWRALSAEGLLQASRSSSRQHALPTRLRDRSAFPASVPGPVRLSATTLRLARVRGGERNQRPLSTAAGVAPSSAKTYTCVTNSTRYYPTSRRVAVPRRAFCTAIALPLPPICCALPVSWLALRSKRYEVIRCFSDC
jgi:hypothetical protein